LAYQLVVQGSCDGRNARMFSEAVMAEPWDSVGTPKIVATRKGTCILLLLYV
jgi:hypothetical protein